MQQTAEVWDGYPPDSSRTANADGRRVRQSRLVAMNSLEQTPRMTPYGSPYMEPEGAWPKVRGQLRELLRKYGQVTAPLRGGPDYLVIGTKRGGTTSIARWLLAHPEVRPLFPARETRKGTYYFDINFGRGESWYRSHFPTRIAHGLRESIAGRRLLVGEATPYYLHHPHAAVRARRFAPDARVIVLLRDPVERSYSHWVERTRNGVENLSYREAIEAEADRIEGEEARMLDDPSYVSFPHQHFSYVDQGRYSRGLKRWLDVFPPEQVLVLRSEDLYEDPAAVYNQVLDFLDLSPHTPEEFSAFNKKPKEDPDPELAREIRAELAPSIQELEELLGRPMGWM